MNLYEYVRANPLTHLDPAGLQCQSQIISSTFIIRFSGLIGHEFLDIGGQKRGFYPDQDDKPGLFECVPGVWTDEDKETVGLPDGREVPRDVILQHLGDYHKWQVKSRLRGKMQYSDKKGLTCRCVSIYDIKRCLLGYSAPGKRSTYCAIGRNCRDYVQKALKACCATRGKRLIRLDPTTAAVLVVEVAAERCLLEC